MLVIVRWYIFYERREVMLDFRVYYFLGAAFWVVCSGLWNSIRTGKQKKFIVKLFKSANMVIAYRTNQHLENP
jgi:hypothetical protein